MRHPVTANKYRNSCMPFQSENPGTISLTYFLCHFYKNHCQKGCIFSLDLLKEGQV